MRHLVGAFVSPACTLPATLQQPPPGQVLATVLPSNTLTTGATPLPSPSPAVHVERARDLLGTDLAALVGESYERAYADMLRVQQLTELEEILAVKWEEEEEAGGRANGANGSQPLSALLAGGLGGARRGRALIQEMWNGRLRGVQRNVEVWQALLRCGAERVERVDGVGRAVGWGWPARWVG